MLTNCPECNHKVSDKAHSCPNCGHPFANRDVVFVKHERKTTNLKYLGFWDPNEPILSYLKLGISAVGLMIIIYGLITNQNYIPFGAILILLVVLTIMGQHGIFPYHPFYRGFVYFPPKVVKYTILRRRRKLVPPPKKKNPDPEDNLRNTQIIEPLTPDDL